MSEQNSPKEIAQKLVNEFGVLLALQLATFCQKEFSGDRDDAVVQRWKDVKRAVAAMSNKQK